MGQYYKAVNASNREWVDSGDGGAKLMEHSYIGNSFVEAVEFLLIDDGEGNRGRWSGNRIVWAGDYANGEPGNGNNLYSLTEENQIRINLNHPTKEIIWVFNRNGTSAPLNDYSIGTNIISNGTPAQFAPLYSFKLILNGTDRFKERPGEYFRLNQTYDHHTRTPGNYIYSYSFALKPEEHQPSGTCNFSRIDSSLMYFYLRNTSSVPGNSDSIPQENYTNLPSFTIYAPCYNILRIMGGMGGLAFSN